jgi:hypothetical protein
MMASVRYRCGRERRRRWTPGAVEFSLADEKSVQGYGDVKS